MGLCWHLSKSSAHGLSWVGDKDTGTVRRVVWLLLFLASLAGLVWMLYNTFVSYMLYPFNTLVSSRMTSPLPFPALTVCNMNAMDLTKMAPDRSEPFDRLMKAVMTGPGHTNSFEDPTVSAMEQETATDLFKETEVNVSDFLVSCDYNNRLVNCASIFDPFQLVLDRCFMLNVSRLPLATKRTTLKLLVLANKAGYMSVTDTLGAKFHVHAPGDVPDMMTTHHVASVGYTTNVALSVHEHHYLPSPFMAFNDHECVDTESPAFRQQMDGDPELYVGSRGSPYSLDACLWYTAERAAAALCNCTSTQQRAEFSQCSLKEMMNCMAVKINTVMETALEKGDLLGCPRPCHALRYLPIISSAFFPAPAFFSVLQNSTLNVTSLSEFRQNYLQLNFHFQDMSVHETRQVPQYDYVTIMGLVGGNMGLFLGASLLSLAEIPDILLTLLFSRIRRSC